MGTSTNAILAYGWELGDDWEGLHPELAQEEDFGGWFLAKLVEPLGVMRPASANEDAAGWERYWDAAFPIDEEGPVTVEFHCHIDAPRYIICLRKYTIEAHRGDPHNVDPAALQVADDDRKLLIDTVDAIGLKGLGDPGWHLASYWA